MKPDPQNVNVVFSEKAYLGIVVETYERVGTETGGIFLGKFIRGKWYVLETLDPGPNSIFSPAYFEYDTPYVNHLANKIERFYKSGLELIGLWHRHPGNFSSFSNTDNSTNIKYASQNDRGAISALVNLVPDFKLTLYHVGVPLRYTLIDYQVDDELIPSEIKELKSITDYLSPQNPRLITRTSVIPNETMIKQNTFQSNYPVKKHNGCIFSWFVPTKIRHEDNQITSTHQKDEPLRTFLPVHENLPNTVMDSHHEILLNMIDNELSFLESQIDYDYGLKIEGNEVTVSLQYIQKMSYYPKQLRFIFGMINNKGYVKVNGEQYQYTQRFIKEHINKSIQDYFSKNHLSINS